MTEPTAFTVLALAGAAPAELVARLRPHLLPAANPGLCHLVVLVASHHAAALRQALRELPVPLLPLASDLPDPLPTGFHRLHGAQGTLTLCVGEWLPTVAALACQATHVWVDTSGLAHLPETAVNQLAKALARQCVRGAVLQAFAPEGSSGPPDTHPWLQAGFVTPPTEPQGAWVAHYLPRWPVPTPVAATPAHALVIGAGLAGAAVCASLTRRGWRVDLLDQHSGPSQGASALPVGMLSEHVTAQETVLSELSRVGMAMHLRELQAHVPSGAGWQATVVANLRHATDATAAAPLPAAMVRPAALVQAWLAQASATGRLTSHWQQAVAQLRRSPTEPHLWQALDAQGNVQAQAPHVVVTAAHGTVNLLAPHMAEMTQAEPLRAVKGQMTYGPLTVEPLAPHPVRDHGVYVPCYEDSGHPTAHRLWTMGSTYERGQNNRDTTPQATERNAQSLHAMLPAAHDLLRSQQARGELLDWAEVRCASLDRLPLVGAVPAPGPLRPSTALADVPRVPGLWTLSALGSRGLTLSILAAELLVARMLGEPWPVEKKHAEALDPARFALKRARKFA